MAVKRRAHSERALPRIGAQARETILDLTDLGERWRREDPDRVRQAAVLQRAGWRCESAGCQAVHGLRAIPRTAEAADSWNLRRWRAACPRHAGRIPG